MKRDKKKTWRDYEYCSYQFRTDPGDKKEIEDLIGKIVEKANEAINLDEDKKVTIGEIATRLLKQALAEELRRLEKMNVN